MYWLDPEDEDYSTVVHQAVGMVSVQADCDLREAFDRLTIRAKASGVHVHMVALDVVDRVIRFS